MHLGDALALRLEEQVADPVRVVVLGVVDDEVAKAGQVLGLLGLLVQPDAPRRAGDGAQRRCLGAGAVVARESLLDDEHVRQRAEQADRAGCTTGAVHGTEPGEQPVEGRTKALDGVFADRFSARRSHPQARVGVVDALHRASVGVLVAVGLFELEAELLEL